MTRFLAKPHISASDLCLAASGLRPHLALDVLADCRAAKARRVQKRTRGAVSDTPPMPMSLPEPHFTATAGEYFVAHKLAMLGLVPAFIRSSMRTVDLIVSNSDASRSVGVQICTVPNAMHDLRRAAPLDTFTLDFPLSQRVVAMAADSTIFCFVDLMIRSPNATPRVYIIPATILKRDFIGVHARKYVYAQYRRSHQAMEYYRDNWRPFQDALKCDPRPPKLRGNDQSVETHPANVRSASAASLTPSEMQPATLDLAGAETAP